MMKIMITMLALMLGISMASAQDRINGGGSSFVKGMMDKWTSEYKKQKGVEIDYQSVGSGAGITKMINGDYDFGCSDAPLSKKQEDEIKAKGHVPVHIPLCMGGVVPAYNLTGLSKPLNFTGPLLADIFMCKITKWNDPKIKALNPDVNLPDQAIVVVRRSDGSGTTFIWADYLSRTSDEWKQSMGVNTTLTWNNLTVGQKGNEGVAGYLKNNPGSIGYVELLYSLQNKISFGAVQNKEGEFILGSMEAVSLAAANAKIPTSLKYSLNNIEGKGVYPISGTVWAVLYQKPRNGKVIVDFLTWVTSPEGQKYTKELHYAPLPDGLQERCQKALATIVAQR